ncbi:N-formylglutamate amidohydrolase [Novosphingobium album (ex Liu et al. 2023)]|uniref:N-formylglutamate amidohydrolase n=1 Tax=Novosphingobium album (ex Liu et al. 2023) TaxID=3031130 RepID=A0ABT5WNH0_9SPHN|nr:N-formylglutamate amidohydrolase [Novosphingobium album (ex Liu et al. 2023)]MDE8651589.1 N-formylglutamate amidohydrolase [Novosphingobium album (ex Liu et al. 2023)]
MSNDEAEGDSRRRAGGIIPGAAGVPAFTLTGSEPSALPVLIAVPHAGRAYPRALLRDMRQPASAALKLEDRFVDRVAIAVARATGATLLVAHAPRAMIDLNRAPDDVDWEMFGRNERPDPGSFAPGRRARSGLGLIPRRLPGMGELWRRRHDETDLAARITGIHAPYHQALAGAIAAVRERWGAALLLDLHSMPPLPARPGVSTPRFVIGDRFGATCHGSLVAGAFAHFNQSGYEAAHNRPYAGGYVLERHARPDRGIHAMQIEIDRALYLDSRLAEPIAPGLDDVADLLTGLVRQLAGEVSALGQAGDTRWSQAAE